MEYQDAVMFLILWYMSILIFYSLWSSYLTSDVMIDGARTFPFLLPSHSTLFDLRI